MDGWVIAVLAIFPPIIVAALSYYLLNNFLEQRYKLQLVELQSKTRDAVLPIKLQAYERLALFSERISIPSLLSRLRTRESSNGALRVAMLMAVQQEYEHNLSQQVYVSEKLWQILSITKENTLELINKVASELDRDAPASQLSEALLRVQEQEGLEINLRALQAIRREAGLLLG